MTEIKTLWKDQYFIPWEAVTPAGKLGLASLAGFMQESAWKHAHHLGVGFEQLEDSEQVWVLIRMRMEIRQYPVWGEQLTLETWPAGIEGSLAIRNFRFTNSRNQEIGCASTSWLIIHSATRRPQRPDQLRNLPVGHPEDGYPVAGASKIIIPGGGQECYTNTVRFRDLDAHGHVNNNRYLSWMLDAFSTEWHRSHQIVQMTVNFLQEAFEGETIRLQKLTDENRHTLWGIRIPDEKLIFAGEIESYAIV